MARSANQKLKLLYLAQYLLEESDEQHPLSVQQMIAYLAARDISAERKSIYDDMAALEQFGLDVIHAKTRPAGYYIGSRRFELAELKLLVDAVQSSRFLTHKKSIELIGKIESLASRNEANSLQRQVYVTNRIKTMNESIYYNVDEIHAAIAEDKKISFRYFDYAVPKARVFRHDGRPYIVSPFALTWDDENYYMIAYDTNAGILKHYRVDKMTSIGLTDLPRDGREAFAAIDMGKYAGTLFGMFSGSVETVSLRFENRLAGAVIDRFGTEIILTPDGEDHFTTQVRVAVSEQFFGYIAGFGGAAQILGPASVKAAMRDHIRQIAALYEKDSVSG